MDWHRLFPRVDLVPLEDTLTQRENFVRHARPRGRRFRIPFEAFARRDVGEIGMERLRGPLEKPLNPGIANIPGLALDRHLDFDRLEPEEIDDPPVLPVR